MNEKYLPMAIFAGILIMLAIVFHFTPCGAVVAFVWYSTVLLAQMQK